MAVTQKQVIELYIATFGRAADSTGLNYWVNDSGLTIEQIAQSFFDQPETQALYPDTSTDADFVASIYTNTFGRAADAAGAAYWEDQLSSGALTRPVMLEAMKNGALGDDATLIANKTAVSEAFAAAGIDDTTLAASVLSGVTIDPTTVTAAEAIVNANAVAGETFTLTNGSDTATANVFNADMVYTPDGSDRILSLQDEDDLTGTAGRVDNTLNTEIGNINANEGTTATVTPSLTNIQKLNIDWTGNTNTLDLRYSDSVDTININKITQDANAITVQNITTVADTLKIQDVYDNTSTQTFTYVRGVLGSSSDTLNLTENNVLTNAQTFNVGGGANEGFESVAMAVSGGVDIQTALTVNEMENLTVSGSGSLDILNQVWTANEYNLFTAAIANPGSTGQRTIDMSDFTGTSNIDISLNLGRQIDPNASGAAYYGVTTGGSGDDTFHTNVAVAANVADTVHNVIDGGTGDNTLVSYNANIAGTRNDTQNVADINNIQHLELRDQTAGNTTTTVDMDAFDAELKSIFMRTESTGNSTFTLDDMTADQAASAMTISHGISTAGADTVVGNLKDATGTDDTMAISVVNGLNTGTVYNYTLGFAGEDTDGIVSTASTDADAIENVTIHDNDTESNTVTLTNIINHTGKTILDGGTAGKTYTVAGTLNSATVDASAQASDLRLTVGDTVGTISTITQDVKLGTGNDVLTYANIDELDATDSLTDAGGNDTVRAAFSKDSSVDVAGIENLHVTATANVKLDMAKADVTNLVLLANSATSGGGTTGTGDLSANGTADINIAASSLPANIVTLDNSTLSQLNFFGDADNNDTVLLGGVAAIDDVFVHTFNGVTLSNNTANDITVNINTSLDENQLASTGGGATSYTIGQITTHGNTGMDIQVGNEKINAGTTTTINNIYAKNMDTLTATATGNLNLGTVSGAPLNNSLKTFDMSKVGGVVTANIISLGDSAKVTLANGNNTVSGLGSAGKNVTITAGNGNNTLTGTAQDDTITAGSGFDTIAGDRGNNVITAGAGNDTVTAKDGSDTIDLGTGVDIYADNVNTNISANTATNSVSMSGGVAAVSIDVNGNGVIGAGEVDQTLAVGTGSDLTISWLGGTMNAATAVLDGALSSVDVMTATAGSDLIIQTAGGVDTVAASAGNDVYITSAAGSAVNFSGGAGNDAVVGSVGTDILNGGTGADKYVLQNTAALDGKVDVITITDGDSIASSYDQVSGFDASGAAGVVSAAPVIAGTAGDDYLDLDLAFATGALTLTASGSAATGIANAAGLVSFTNSVAPSAANNVVGSAANQVQLADALAYLSANTAAGATYVFQYDVNGDGLMTAADSTFVFQDGVTDTVVELVGVNATGAEVVTGGTAGFIEIG